MAVIKQACPKCGQRVSGDESFYGTSVECPICTSQIFFPDPNKKEDSDQKASADDRKSGEPDSAGDSADADRDAAKKDEKGEKESSSASSSSLEDLAERKRKTESSDARDDSAPPKMSPPQSSIPLNQPSPATYSEAPSPTLSIMSMVLGILNAVTFCLPSMLLAPAAIICGHIALIKGQFSPIQPAPGRSMAITGLILGYIGMAVMFIVLGLAITGVFNIFDWTRGHFDNGAGN